MKSILCLASGDPNDPRSFSGSLRQWLRALDAHGALLGAVDVDCGRATHLRAWVDQIRLRRRLRAAKLLARWTPAETEKRSRRAAHWLQRAAGARAVLLYGTDFYPAPPGARAPVPVGAALDCTFAQLTRAGEGHFSDLTAAEAARCIEVQRNVLERCDVLFPRTQWCADSLHDDYGIPPERCIVTGAGPNFDAAPPAHRAYDGRTILFVGRDWSRKNGQLVLDAFALARARRPELKLWVVGVPGSAEIPGVEWFGALDGNGRDVLAEAYSRACLFIMPSRFEPFGMALVEAMTAGCPVVTLDRAPSDELYRSGEHGEAVGRAEPRALASTMLRWLADPERCAQAGASAQRWACERFTWERAAREVMIGFDTIDARGDAITPAARPLPAEESAREPAGGHLVGLVDPLHRGGRVGISDE